MLQVIFVTPAKAGVQYAEMWIPVFTGMTGRRCDVAGESLKTERPWCSNMLALVLVAD